MGMIRISIQGSFHQYPGIEPTADSDFSAHTHGHAQAVAEAISFLSNEVMTKAIANDHRLQASEQYPESGHFGAAEAQRGTAP